MIDGKGLYSLPALAHGYGELAPFISEQLLRVHHDGHHLKYVNQTNGTIGVSEHAHYRDYKNEKAKYAANFWKVVNWDLVDRRLEKILGGKKEGIAVPVAPVGGSL